MIYSLSRAISQPSQGRWIVLAILSYAAVCVGLLGYFLIFPDEATRRSQAELRQQLSPAESAKKQGRYESVIANWNRYRAQTSAEDK